MPSNERPSLAPDHDATTISFFAAKINHAVRDRRIALNAIGAGPEKQVARLQRIEFERVGLAANDSAKISGLPHPDILLAGIARHVVNTVFCQDVINETGTIHAAVSGISRAIFISEILLREFERHVDNLAHGFRIIFVIRQLVRRNRRVGRAFPLRR